LTLLNTSMGLLLVPVTALAICRTWSGVRRPMPELRHLESSWASLKCLCCLSRFTSASAAARAAFASAARCFSASVRCLVPVSRGVAASPCAVFYAICVCTCVDAVLAPDGFPSWGLSAVAVSSTHGTCYSAGGALAPLLCELSISLDCTFVSCSRSVSPPSYPWTLVLRPHRMQLA
jgi:hypothetical protein